MIAQAVKLRQQAQEERDKLEAENQRLRTELKERFRPANIVGNSREMQVVYDQIAQVAKSQSTVLIVGETGTGKELVANAIHYNSDRSDRPFIRVHCAALPESIIESELFGHEKGAFTGAVVERKGRFELADGGTLFLDEISEVSQALQIKLLRVLQEREFERVGGSKTIRVNVRVLAATNRDLMQLVKEGKFREDLYYRLHVFPIYVPPLRKRAADVVLLADYFLEKYSKETGRHVRRLSSAAIDMLMSYHWPGNVRELENCLERAVLVAEGDVIYPHHLPPTLQTAEATTPVSGDLESLVSAYERDLITDALKSSRGNMAAAARALGATQRIIGYKVKLLGIESKKYSGQT
jgi:Nif-specific regulatory protein